MSTKRRSPRATHRRRGFQSLELLLVVPILAVLLLATLECGRGMMVRCGVVHAATLAAREAGKGADVAGATQAARSALAAYGVAIDDRPRSGANVTVHDGGGSAAQCGDPSMAVLVAPAVGRDEILVTVSIQLGARRADGHRLLAPSSGLLGLALGGNQLRATSLVKKQSL